eukprot:s712_g28.t1
MIQVNVTLPSGRTEHFSLEASSKVGDLRSLAKQSFNQGFLRLVTQNGHVLADPRESLQAAGVEDGDNLTAIALEVSVMASARAFAIWCNGGGKLVTWGDPDCGGDSSAVQDQLTIHQLQASDRAFAAVLADGSVVTWGNCEFGGDSSKVEQRLKNVRDIQATGGAFAAILTDGSVVTWGDPDVGGDSSEVQANLRNVRLVQGSRAAFAAILTDGSVVSWGPPFFGGNSSEVKDELRNVQRIQGSMAFAAICHCSPSTSSWSWRATTDDSAPVV